MVTNFIKVFYRNMTRNRGFSIINITGLAVGLATCLLIMLYIFDERSYDRHHQDGNDIYRLASTSKGETWAAMPGPVAGALKENLPEVKAAARLLTFTDINKMIIRYDDGIDRKQFIEPNGFYVDSTFFEVLTYDFIQGNPKTALLQPNSIVMSDVMAAKFFGNLNPVQKVVVINTPFGEFNYTVTGVYSTGKNKSHIPANYFLSMRNSDMWNWVKNQTSWSTNNVFYTYVKVSSGTNAKDFEKRLNVFFDRHAGEQTRAAGFTKTLFIQPLKDIYLHSSIGNEIGTNGNITYLYILGSIAIFILVIACINFMNLSTARSERRAKEIGIRKVVGAERVSLIRQFLGESFLMCLLALGISVLIVWLVLPYFNNLTQKNIDSFERPVALLWVAGLTLATGLLAGLYPAFYLSGFRPVAILKGKMPKSVSAAMVRKGLVVFQFTVSISLMLAAIIIFRQLDFLRKQQLGFNKTQKIVIPLQMGYLNTENNYNALRNELLKNPEIKAVSSGSTYPGVPNLSDILFYPVGKTPADAIDVRLSVVEKEYIETLGFEMLSGRSFSGHFAADSSSIILNETAVKQLGYDPQEAVGKNIQFDFNEFHSSLQIVGVLKDFNFESLHTSVKPFGFMTKYFGNRYGYVIADVNTTGYASLLKKIEKSWATLHPAVPFTWSFLDEDFQRNYGKEQLVSRIVVAFTCVAILVACLGLFGLAAFSAGRRTREIGIRKVLGASVSNVTVLLSKDFVSLVLLALVIASPVAWYIMKGWLQAFAYKVNISWWIFVVTGLAAIIIALITVSFQAIRAAIANPVKSLRSE